MRALHPVLLIFVSVTLAQQAPTQRKLTTADAAALKEPISTGRRVVVALASYCQDTPLRISDTLGGFTLLTTTPTVEILHVYRYISDSDFEVCRRYRATLQVVPPDALATQPLLTMDTTRGLLLFQMNGEVTLEPAKCDLTNRWSEPLTGTKTHFR